MEQLIPFFYDHWILASAFFILLLALAVNEIILKAFFTANSLSAEEAVQWINHKGAIVVDIRESQNFSDAHILGSINIPLASLEKKLGLLEKYKDRDLIVVSSAGHEGQKLVRDLKQKGFKPVSLAGGLSAWRTAGLPLTKN